MRKQNLRELYNLPRDTKLIIARAWGSGRVSGSAPSDLPTLPHFPERGCGGLNKNGPHRPIGIGTIRRYGIVVVMAVLEEICH